MTKEELERQKWNDIFLEDCAVYDKKIAEEYTTLEEQIAKLKEENKELKEVHESDKRSLRLIAEKGADFEREISILLSCKNCPNNKGGLLCQKEYEDKCLAQKIQYIKELQEENTELKDKLNNLSKVAEVRLANWQKYEKAYNETDELLDKQIEATYNVVEENKEAKEIIHDLLIVYQQFNQTDTYIRAERFLKE